MTPSVIRRESQQEWANRVDPGLQPDLDMQFLLAGLTQALGRKGVAFAAKKVPQGLEEALSMNRSLGEQGSLFPKNQKMVDSTIKKYGVTKSPEETGYILPRGERLDFSGRTQAVGYEGGIPKLGEPDYLAGQRNIDHRDVSHLLESDFDRINPINSFMRESGGIRYQGNSGIEVNDLMSDEQLRSVVADFRGSGEPLNVDIVHPDGSAIESKIFNRPTVQQLKSYIGKFYGGKQ